MSVRSLQCLFENVFDGYIDTREGQKTIHKYCANEGLTPSIEKSLSEIMSSFPKVGFMRRYEEFMHQVNWLLATVAAKEVEPEVAIYCLEKEFEKLKCYHAYPEGKEIFLL